MSKKVNGMAQITDKTHSRSLHILHEFGGIYNFVPDGGLCVTVPIVCKIVHIHNHIIQWGLVSNCFPTFLRKFFLLCVTC